MITMRHFADFLALRRTGGSENAGSAIQTIQTALRRTGGSEI